MNPKLLEAIRNLQHSANNHALNLPAEIQDKIMDVVRLAAQGEEPEPAKPAAPAKAPVENHAPAKKKRH